VAEIMFHLHIGTQLHLGQQFLHCIQPELERRRIRDRLQQVGLQTYWTQVHGRGFGVDSSCKCCLCMCDCKWGAPPAEGGRRSVSWCGSVACKRVLLPVEG
jgi:hypothetical protein